MDVRRLLGTLLLLLGGTASAAEAPAAPETLRVGIDRDFPPFEYLDEQGEPTGFSVELVRAIASHRQLELEFVPGPWHRIREELEAGRIDVAPSMVMTPERDRLLDFSAPTVAVEYRVFVPEHSELETLADVMRAGVAVEQGTFWHDRLVEKFPSVPRSTYETAVDVLRAVAEGRAPAGVLLLHQRLYLARREGIGSLRSIGEPLHVQRYRLAVPEGRRELLHSLNDGLAAVHESGVYDAFYDRWLGVLRDEGMLGPQERRWLLGVGGVLAALLLLALLWSHTLQAELERRTRQLREEEERGRALERQLFQDRKMEALGRLAAGVAHDFNNLLSLILGSASLAQGNVPAGSPLAERLARIRAAGESAARLVEQLLAFSRRQSVEPRPLSWNAVVRESREMLERPLTRAIQVHFQLASDLWPVLLDRSQALQVLLNLLLNARDAIPSTGNVWVETANVSRGGEELVRLTVRDDGQGLDEETRERIFEPFFTTKEEGRGTGLGLATVYGIVQQNGGSIEVHSRPGEGARFDVLLPRATKVARLS